MLLVKCRCADCRILFDIRFKRPQPPWPLTCPVCQGKLIEQRNVYSDYYEKKMCDTGNNEDNKG